MRIGKIISESNALPGQFRATFQLEDDVNLEITVSVIDQVPRCAEVRVYGTGERTEVAARHLREAKLEDLIEHACDMAALVAKQGATHVAYEPVMTVDIARRAIAEVRLARRDARKRGYSDDLLREVAEVYDSAERSPTKAVREAFEIAQSTAQLYVKKARERGFITRPAPPGRGKRANSEPSDTGHVTVSEDLGPSHALSHPR